MKAELIVRPGGVARRLRTMPGHFTVDRVGDWMPVIADGEPEAIRLLDEREYALRVRQQIDP
ncbi:hypothetical protein GCM10011608_09150 [Micromonospora sonchi]|uniref:Uncharacterized protein n=1 Tax=Micromonospora sonchi TaxID=1763543 RepID=A0A917TL57_9ACTN|nr:hypothetical protein [Micromonospora sonchi]GGM26551.1 hypothetical protein GCM10011608_09150 [Micromonospora sonchi]